MRSNQMSKWIIIEIIIMITVICQMTELIKCLSTTTNVNIDSKLINNNSSGGNNSSTIRKLSLRERFEIITNDNELLHMSNNDDNNKITHILMPNNLEQQQQQQQYYQQRMNQQTHTTFRPSSAILYLHPPKPRHIESIETMMIILNVTSNEILIGWQVIAHLRNDDNGMIKRSKRKIDAKVEEEINPLSFNLYIRNYGQTNRQKFRLIDENNTLDGPITNNKTYQHRINGLQSMSAYELCLQSVNAGQIKETNEIATRFPVNALTELAGRNNPLFICKEIVLPSSSSSQSTTKSSKYILDSNSERNETKFTGRNFNRNYNHKQNDNNNNDETTTLEIDEDLVDRFVVYSAITTGTTTIFVLILLLIFCCCRCKRRNIVNKEQIMYNHALLAHHNHPHHRQQMPTIQPQQQQR